MTSFGAALTQKAHSMALRRWLILPVSAVLLVSFGVNSEASAATKRLRAGNQCKAKQAGVTTPSGLTCNKKGARYVWEGAVGPGCHNSYATPPCVPRDTDVDCAGGSGNGPSYVKGPVQVIGDDVYGLDANDDGIGCEEPKR